MTSSTLDPSAGALAQFRMSPQQARLFRLVEDGGAAARARAVLLLDGPLDRGRLEAAIAEIVARHEILRTTYRALPGTSAAAQVPLPPGPIDLVEARAGGDPEARLREIVEGAGRPLGDGLAAPLRAALVPLADDRHALVLDLPAPSADRRSLALLTDLVASAYAVPGAGEPVGLQYADVSEVLNDLLESPETEAGRRWFREIDLGRLIAADLAGDGRAPARGAAPRALHVPLSPALSASIDAATRAAHVEPWALVLAAWQALLRRLGGEPCAPAVAFPGRTYEGLDAALGLFERRLPLPPAVDGRRPLADLARDTAARVAEAASFQDYFDLDRELSARGELHHPGSFFPLSFTAFDWPEPSSAHGLRVSAALLEAQVDRVGLELVHVRRAARVELELRYDPSLHEEGEVTRLAERLSCLLEGAVASPDAALDDLPVVGPGERALISSAGRAPRPWPVDGTIHERFEAQAARTPARDAVVAGAHRLTYAELSARSSRLARALCALDVAPGARVGVCLERGVDLVTSVLGVLKAGAAYVPLDPMAPRERLANMLAQAGARVVVTQGSLRALLPDAGVRTLALDDDAASLAREPPDPPSSGVGPDHPAYVIFTSGSTGKPKGVMVQHRSVLNLAAALGEAVYDGRGEGLRVSLNAPLAFDASVKQWIQILAGHTICVVPEEARLDPTAMCELLRTSRIDVLDTTPSQLAGLHERGLGHDAGLSPGLVLVGGEAIGEAAWRALAASPRTTFVNVYGPTECTVDATLCVVRRGAAPSIGGPLDNVRVHVLDAALRPAPIGAVGELWIGGAGVALGYVGSPALTAERFLPDPFGPPGARMYRTGDLARLRADGSLAYLGRVDGQVKLRGLRIELGEIEAALKDHEAVLEAAVVVREIAPGVPHLVGYFVPRDTPGVTPALGAEIRAALRQTLPEYMVPWALVPLAALPLTRNGKLDRGALPDPRAAIGPDASCEPPASEAERIVAAIWQEVLGTAHVGRDSNFFDLGGHSLLMVRVHQRLSAAFGSELSLVELFRHPTVAAIARRLTEGADADSPAVSEATTDRAARQRLATEKQAQRNRAGRTPR